MLYLILILFQLVNSLKIVNEFIEEPKDIERIIGSTVLLHCRTKSVNETEVTWCKNDFCTLGKSRDLPFYPRYEIIGNPHLGEHHFQITNLSLEDIGIYQCQIRAQPQRPPSMSRKAKLTVLQIPTRLSIDSPIVLIENVLSYIICRSSNSMPEAKLSWHFPPSINYLSQNDYVILSDQSLTNSISNITLKPNRSFHGKLIQCQAHSTAIQILNQTILTQQYIQTIFPPEVNISLIGQMIENEMISINCDIFSRPLWDYIQWFNGSHLVNLINEKSFSIRLERSMHNNQITCQVKNSIGITNKSLTLQFSYRPIFVDINGNQVNNYSVVLVNEGESIELECFIDSYPSSFIFWTFKENVISKNETIIQINSINSNKDIGLYQCYVEHYYFGKSSKTIRLALKSPPEFIEDKTISSISIGQTIELICSISKDIPFQNVFWSREDQMKINSNEKYQMISKENDHLIEYKLVIKNVLITDQGIYICTSINQFGSSTKQSQLIIRDQNHFSIKYFILFLTIAISILLSFILILLLLIKYFYSKKRTKYSRRDQSLFKQQFQLDQTNSTIDQCLFQEQQITNHIHDLLDSSSNHFFYSEDYTKTYSTVV